MTSSWKALRNKHKGETALVIGNGPSLNDVPVDFLGKYPSFGTNRIYLLDKFTPTYYVAVDPLTLEQFNGDIDQMECEKFIAAFYTKHLITDAYSLYSSAIPSFSREPDKWIYEGHTVTFVCLQLAFYMGFSTVLLVGVDHSYEFEGRPNQMMIAEGDDVNHFHPEYFSNGRKWHNPDLVQSGNAYHMAQTVFEHDGRKIINLTRGTKLDVFEKGDWQEW